MGSRQDYYLGFVINGVAHRTWGHYAGDTVRAGKALAKLPGVEAVLVIGVQSDKPSFEFGDTSKIA